MSKRCIYHDVPNKLARLFMYKPDCWLVQNLALQVDHFSCSKAYSGSFLFYSTYRVSSIISIYRFYLHIGRHNSQKRLRRCLPTTKKRKTS